MTEEEWRKIPGYENYEVSSHGRVRAKTQRRQHWIYHKMTITRVGYRVVGLYREGKNKVIPVHQLVALAFHGPRPEGLQTRHLDGNKLNNFASNLKYGTAKENCQDKMDHGGQVEGESHPMVKISEADARAIRDRVARGEKHRDIAKDFGIDKTLISHIACGRIWRKAGGACINTKPKCKISENDVREIRRLNSCGVSRNDIQKQFDLTSGAVSMIITRRRWKNVE